MRAALTLSLALVALAAAPARAAPLSWQGDPAHRGVVAEEIAPPLTRAWARDLGYRIAYPVMAEGRIFVTSAPTEDRYGAEIHAIDPATGQTLWSHAIPGPYWRAYAGYDDGRVFVTNYFGEVWAFHAASGEPLWQRSPWRAVNEGSMPIAAGGLVYVSGQDENEGVAALRQSDGEEVWRTTTWTGAGFPALDVDAGRLYLTTDGGDATALDAATGAVLWRVESAKGGSSTFNVVGAGRLFAFQRPEDVDGFAVHDLGDGATAWRSKATSPPALTPTTAYFAEGTAIVARDPSGGGERWRFTGPDQISGPPLVVGDVVYAFDAMGRLYALDRDTGAARWSGQATDGAAGVSSAALMSTGMAAGQGLLLVPTLNGVLEAWRPAGGGGQTASPGPQPAGAPGPAAATPRIVLSVPRRSRWSLVRRRGLPVVLRGLSPRARVRVVLRTAGGRTLAERAVAAGTTGTVRLRVRPRPRVRRGARATVRLFVLGGRGPTARRLAVATLVLRG